MYVGKLNVWTDSSNLQRENSSNFHFAKNGGFGLYLPSIFGMLWKNNSTDWLYSAPLHRRFLHLKFEPLNAGEGKSVESK